MRPDGIFVSRAFSLLFVLLLSACGGSGGDGDSPASAGSDSDVDSIVEPTAEPVVEPTVTPNLNSEPEPGSSSTTDTSGIPDANPIVVPVSNPEPETLQPGGDTDASDALAPLSATPASPPPGPDDEPTNVNTPVVAITDFFLVQNPALRIEPVSTLGLTNTDFEAGTPEPNITAPNGFDTNTNASPYFEGISNREVFAGQTLEVLYRPLDEDGGLPGMFPNELPESASFNDNLNGTKSFRWVPLQGDIGITSFTVTAVDSQEPNYRSEQTILIRVLEPDDPSTIPNFPPVVNAVRDHTVRVGDPVVLELKGSDRNSTYPSVEVLNPPAGATVTPHYIFDEISVLRFIPQTPGVIEIEVLVRDADDPSLTSTRTVRVIAEAAEEFVLPGRRLRDLAGERNFLLGFAAVQEFYKRPDGALYSDLAGREFNIVSAENSMKWDYVNPEPGTFRWADADNVIAFAQRYNQVVHGHPMIWYTQLPIWVREAPESTLEAHMREFIDRLATRYGDDVAIWDVVNEPIADEGGFRQSIWFNAMGEDYIDIAFRQARESAPDGILLLNEYDIAWDTPKTATLFPLLESLQEKGTPIDGVGFQMHISANFDDFDEVEANFQRVADMGLDIYITELDVSNFDGVNTGTLENQARVYERVLEICLNQPACKALQLWGYTDQYSWRRPFTPLMLDREYKVKPAYTALQNKLLD